MTHPMFPKSHISKVICLAGLIAMVLGLQGFAQVARPVQFPVSCQSFWSVDQANVTNTDTNEIFPLTTICPFGLSLARSQKRRNQIPVVER